MQYCEDELLARAEECDDELALRRLEDQAKFARSYGTRHVAERYDEIIAAARQANCDEERERVADERKRARRAKRDEEAAAAGVYVVRRRSYCCVHPYPSTMEELHAELGRRGYPRDHLRIMPGYDISLTERANNMRREMLERLLQKELARKDETVVTCRWTETKWIVPRSGTRLNQFMCDACHADSVSLDKDETNCRQQCGGTWFCAECWESYRDCTLCWESSAQQYVKACCGAGSLCDDHREHLFCAGVDLDHPADLPCSLPGSEKECIVRMTALTALCMEGDEDDIYQHIKAGANYEQPALAVRCTAPGGSQTCSSCNTFVGVAPLELARQRGLDMEDIDELVSRKRRNPRRTTPVKQRAQKIGLELPPTPSGIRQALAGEDDEPKKDARRRLQRHQKACQQAVDRGEKARAEKRDSSNPGFFLNSRREILIAQIEIRKAALARETKKRSWNNHSEAWLQNRKAVVADEQARFDEEHRANMRLWYGID